MSRWRRGISKPRAVAVAAGWVVIIVLMLVKGVTNMPVWLAVAFAAAGLALTLWAGFSKRGRNTWFQKTGPGGNPNFW